MYVHLYVCIYVRIYICSMWNSHNSAVFMWLLSFLLTVCMARNLTYVTMHFHLLKFC